jgi:hypothetical protein
MPLAFRAGALTLCMRVRRAPPESPITRGGALSRQPYASDRGSASAARRQQPLRHVAVITACSCLDFLPEAVLQVRSRAHVLHACDMHAGARGTRAAMQVHLELLHLQLLVWTSDKYERVLVDNPTLDTSAALAGTGASFDGLLQRLDGCMDILLQAVEMLRMRPIIRGAAEASLQQVRHAAAAHSSTPLPELLHTPHALPSLRVLRIPPCPCGVHMLRGRLMQLMRNAPATTVR